MGFFQLVRDVVGGFQSQLSLAGAREASQLMDIPFCIQQALITLQSEFITSFQSEAKGLQRRSDTATDRALIASTML